LLTAVYMTRLMVMTFWGRERFGDAHADEQHHQVEHDGHSPEAASAHEVHTPHESPLSMTIPLIVLAVLSTIGGLVGVPYAISSLMGGHPENYFEEALAPAINHVPAPNAGERAPETVRWLSPPPQAVDGKPAVAPVGEAPNAATAHETPNPEEIRAERLLALVSVLIALSGIGLGWVLFQRQPLRTMPRLLEDKYYVDEVYDAAVINPILVTSREGLWKVFDLGVIDGIIHTVGRAVVNFGRTIRYMQIGLVRGYAAIILAGALIIIGYFAYAGASVLKFLVR
jgi:NADH-quinone oxidoreductase subunit L